MPYLRKFSINWQAVITKRILQNVTFGDFKDGIREVVNDNDTNLQFESFWWWMRFRKITKFVGIALLEFLVPILYLIFLLVCWFTYIDMWRKGKETVTSCALLVAIGLFSALVYDNIRNFFSIALNYVNSNGTVAKE